MQRADIIEVDIAVRLYDPEMQRYRAVCIECESMEDARRKAAGIVRMRRANKLGYDRSRVVICRSIEEVYEVEPW